MRLSNPERAGRVCTSLVSCYVSSVHVDEREGLTKRENPTT